MLRGLGNFYLRDMSRTSPSMSRKTRPEGLTMSHALYRIGHFAGRHPWRVIGAWVVVAVSIVMLNAAGGGAYDEKFTLPGSESQAAADAIQERFPQETLYASNIIF